MARWWKRMLKEPEAQMSSATQNNTKALAKTKSKVVHWGPQISKREVRGHAIDGKTMMEKAQAQKRKNNLEYTGKNSKMPSTSIPFITEIAAKIGVIVSSNNMDVSMVDDDILGVTK